MKFGEYLEMNITPEWSGEYMAYNDLDLLLHESTGQILPSNENNQNESRQPYFPPIEEAFFEVRQNCSFA